MQNQGLHRQRLEHDSKYDLLTNHSVRAKQSPPEQQSHIRAGRNSLLQLNLALSPLPEKLASSACYEIYQPARRYPGSQSTVQWGALCSPAAAGIGAEVLAIVGDCLELRSQFPTDAYTLTLPVNSRQDTCFSQLSSPQFSHKELFLTIMAKKKWTSLDFGTTLFSIEQTSSLENNCMHCACPFLDPICKGFLMGYRQLGHTSDGRKYISCSVAYGEEAHFWPWSQLNVAGQQNLHAGCQ